MLINPLHISCLEMLGLVERAQLTCSQRQQSSRLLMCELLPRASNWWNLSSARKRLLLDQVDQLKGDLRGKLPQNIEFAMEAGAVYCGLPPPSGKSAEMRLSCAGGILALDGRKTAALPARRIGRFYAHYVAPESVLHEMPPSRRAASGAIAS